MMLTSPSFILLQFLAQLSDSGLCWQNSPRNNPAISIIIIIIISIIIIIIINIIVVGRTFPVTTLHLRSSLLMLNHNSR